MIKYIDVKAFKEWIENWFYKHKSYHPYAKTNTIPITELYDILEQMPAADVVEVVRCRECKYREDEQPSMVYCPCMVGGWVDENWFCAGGEKND